MKSLTVYLFLPILIAFCFSAVSAQTTGKTAIKMIDSYCRKVDSFTKKSKNTQLIFADIADYSENSKSIWKKFASEKALEKFRKNSETYSIAYNWHKNNKIIRSNFTLFSPSGDWAKYVYLYFRPDGTLAKAESELRTFYGNLIVLNDIYFNSEGKILKRTVRYSDLETKKPKKPNENDMVNNSNSFKFTEYYNKTNKLPFAHLLKTQKK